MPWNTYRSIILGQHLSSGKHCFVLPRVEEVLTLYLHWSQKLHLGNTFNHPSNKPSSMAIARQPFTRSTTVVWRGELQKHYVDLIISHSFERGLLWPTSLQCVPPLVFAIFLPIYLWEFTLFSFCFACQPSSSKRREGLFRPLSSLQGGTKNFSLRLRTTRLRYLRFPFMDGERRKHKVGIFVMFITK